MFELTPRHRGALETAVFSMADEGQLITAVPFLDAAEIAALKETVLQFDYRTATPMVGNNVRQDFDVCFPAPCVGALQGLAAMLEQGCAALLAKRAGLFESQIKLNDMAVQRYPAGSSGIGIHRDGLRYRNLVFILTLDGQSVLFSCADRQGQGRVVIDDRPGQLVILAAPGFAGLADPAHRPFHAVDQITTGRLSIGLRQERLPTA